MPMRSAFDRRKTVGIRGKIAGALVLLAVALACTSAPSTAPARQGAPSGQPTGSQKTLTIAIPYEPPVLALPISGAGSSITGTDDVNLAVAHRLGGYDERGTPFPMLAAELPSRDQGTWRLRPDGTMRTTHRLRENITWHDGTPVTARDFVFARAVMSNPGFPFSGDVIDLVSEVQALDPLTFALEWKVTYPFAGTPAQREHIPLPAHLLEKLYGEMQEEQFQQLPFWREGFIGTGPYQVASWETGVQFEVRAYDNFYAGRPRIERVIFRFISDQNAVMANLLAGAVDGEFPQAVEFANGMLVKREWERAGHKPTVVLQTDSWRHIFPQFRDPQYPEVRDVRVRRGLLHGIDRVALTSTLLDGETPLADTVFPPSNRKWEWVQDVVVRYAYDARRATELLAEAGWRRGADGGLANAAGERISLPLWTVGGQETEKTTAIVADYWKELGATVEQTIIPRTRYRDGQYRASFPAFLYAGISAEYFNPFRRMEGRECPRPETQWVGTSFGCYLNLEFDGLLSELRATIDPAEERRLWRGLVKIQTEQLPVLPMYFNLNITLFRDGVTGVKGNSQPSTGATWNIAEWDLR